MITIDKKLIIGRFIRYTFSWAEFVWADFVMGRVCHGSSCPVTSKIDLTSLAPAVFTTDRSKAVVLVFVLSGCGASFHVLSY